MIERSILKQGLYDYGEDRIIKQDNFYMVIDGATPLYNDTNPRMLGYKNKTWASWLVSILKESIEKRNKEVMEVLKDVSIKLYNEFIKINPDDSKYFPSCNFAMLQIVGDEAIFTTIGDCEAFIKFKDGIMRRIYQPELIELDKKALDYMISIGGKDKDSVIDMLRENRSLMNKENGYNTYTISANPNFKYTIEKYNMNDIYEIYLYTDGISQAFDEFKIVNNPEELFTKYKTASAIVDDIIKASRSDFSMKKYPRFKRIDDIAIIKLVNNED